MKIIALLPESSRMEEYGLLPTLSYPDSSMVKNGNPVYIPDFDDSFSGHFYLAVKISRLGKNVAERFAARYYSEVAPVIAVFADNLIRTLQKNGLPWTIATGFDKSLVTGCFTDYAGLGENPSMELHASDGMRTTLLLPDRTAINRAVNEVSRYNSLKMGDLILIPIETEPIRLEIDTLITVTADDRILLKLPVK